MCQQLFFSFNIMYLFSPVLQGKKLAQHDTKQWIGMSKEIFDHRAEYDEEPLELTLCLVECLLIKYQLSMKKILFLILIFFKFVF